MDNLTPIIPSPANFYICGIPGMIIQYRSAEQSLRAVEEFFAVNLKMFPKGVRQKSPGWMFDVATCHNTRVSQTPTVSAEVLLELKLLIAKHWAIPVVWRRSAAWARYTAGVVQGHPQDNRNHYEYQVLVWLAEALPADVKV